MPLLTTWGRADSGGIAVGGIVGVSVYVVGVVGIANQLRPRSLLYNGIVEQIDYNIVVGMIFQPLCD